MRSINYNLHRFFTQLLPSLPTAKPPPSAGRLTRAFSDESLRREANVGSHSGRAVAKRLRGQRLPQQGGSGGASPSPTQNKGVAAATPLFLFADRIFSYPYRPKNNVGANCVRPSLLPSFRGRGELRLPEPSPSEKALFSVLFHSKQLNVLSVIKCFLGKSLKVKLSFFN